MESQAFLAAFYALELFAVAAYIGMRLHSRVSACWLVLSSFLLLYGLGYYLYYGEEGFATQAGQRVTLALMVMWPMMIIGMEAARALFPRAARRAHAGVEAWTRMPLQDAFSRDSLLWFALPVLFVVPLIVAIFEGQVQRVMSFYLTLGSDAEARAFFRQDYGGSAFYFVNLLVTAVMPFLSFVLLLKAKVSRNSTLWIVAALAVLGVLVLKLASLQKAPAAVYLLQIALLLVLARRNRIGVKDMVVLTVFFFLAMVPLSQTAFPDIEFTDLPSFFMYRIFTVSFEVLEQYFVFYPDVFQHTYGKGIRLIGQFASDQYVPTAMLIAAELGAEGGSFNAMFMAEAWSEFGLGGVIVYPFIAGFILKCFDLYTLARGKTVESVALYAASLAGVVMLAQVSLTPTLLTGGLLLPFLSWVLRLPLGRKRSLAPETGLP